MRKSIKSILNEKAYVLFTVTIAIILIVIGLSFRTISKISVENEVNSIAEAVKAGLTSHMKAGIMDKKGYFLEEVSTLYNVQSLKIIPSKQISRQYERRTVILDSFQEEVIKNSKSFYDFNSLSLEPTVRAIIPYIASTSGSLNCLSCHNVQKGSVLGVVDITIDFSSFRNITLYFIAVVAIALVLFIFLFTKIASEIIDKKLLSPLKHIIKGGEKAYRTGQKIQKASYESEELEELSEEISLFNNEILEKKTELERTLEETSIIIGRIESYSSEETREHTRRVSKYAYLLGRKLGLTVSRAKELANTSALHDVGKLGISRQILHKNGPLTDKEWEEMKKHTEMGYDMLVHSSSGFLSLAAAIALQHHEKYDGTGYPFGLSGENISMEARIVAVIDVFDAVSNKRAYKDAWSMEESLKLIKDGKGTHFDPNVVDALVDSLDKILEIKKQYS